MAVSLVSTGVQFPDSSIQTTAATAGGSRAFTATGAISNGARVALRSDGTVETVTSTSVTASLGTAVTASTNAAYETNTSVYHPVYNKHILLYTDSSTGVMYVKAATVSGTSVSYGSPTIVENSLTFGLPAAIMYIPSRNILVACYNVSGSSNGVYLKPITYDGTTFTAGTRYTVATGANYAEPATAVYNPAADFYWVSGLDGSSGISRMWGLTYNGTSWTLVGSTTSSTGGNGLSFYALTELTNTVLFFEYSSGSAVWFVSRMALNGTGISKLNTLNTGISDAGWYTTAKPVPGTDEVVGCFSGGNVLKISRISYLGGAVSVNVATYNTAVVASYYSWCFGVNVAANTATAFYRTTGGLIYGLDYNLNDGGVFQVGAIYAVTAVSGNLTRAVTYDPVAEKLLLHYYASGTMTGVVRTPTFTDTNAPSFVGIAAAAISNGASGNVTVLGGVSTNQSGLVANTDYYIAADGSLTTVRPSFGKVGRAFSSTAILIEGD